jgi:diazepam-binding inhibitor (GABA receptor modulating acyl-CoA-binding protein)
LFIFVLQVIYPRNHKRTIVENKSQQHNGNDVPSCSTLFFVIMTSSLQDQFNAAAEKARGSSGVSNGNKLQLYSLFKQATEGSIGDRPRPGILYQTGRAKYDAWDRLGDLSQDNAKQQYIALVETL